MASTTVAQRTEQVISSRLWWIGMLTMTVSVMLNLFLLWIVEAFLPIPAGFAPLAVGPVVAWSLIGSLGATLVFSLLVRLTRRPIRVFQVVALIVFLVTLLPDIALLFLPIFPDTTLLGVGTLMLMHVGTTLICVGFITRFARARQ